MLLRCRYQNSEQADNIPVCNACAQPLAESIADPVGLTKQLAKAPAGDDGQLSTAAVRLHFCNYSYCLCLLLLAGPIIVIFRVLGNLQLYISLLISAKLLPAFRAGGFQHNSGQYYLGSGSRGD